MEWYKLVNIMLSNQRQVLIPATLDENQISQTSLSIKLGGLGMRDPKIYTCASYLSSLVKNDDMVSKLLSNEAIQQTNPFIDSHMQQALDQYNQNVHVDDQFESLTKFREWFIGKQAEHPTGRPSIQSKLYHNIDKSRLTHLTNQLTDRHQAILLQFKDNMATKWIQTRYHIRRLSNTQFCIAILRHLAVPIARDGGLCSSCNQVLDPYGDHALMCSSKRGIKQYHNYIQHSIYQLAKAAGCDVALEYKLNHNNQQIPADIFIKNWDGPNHLAIDISCVSATSITNQKYSSTTRYYAANKAYQNKNRKYRNYDFDTYITTFVPFIIEDFGAMHPEAKKIWDKLCEMAAARTNTSRSQYRLFQSKLFSSNIIQCNTNRIARKYDLGTIPIMD